MRVYVSGPITGVPDYKERFATAIKTVKEAGAEPVYFADTGMKEGLAEWEYLLADLALIPTCQYITAIEGWETSGGCCIEAMFADYAGVIRIPFYVFEQAAKEGL